MKLSQRNYDLVQTDIKGLIEQPELEVTIGGDKPTEEPDLKSDKYRLKFLSEGGVRPSPTELERLIGDNDLVDEFYLERALLAAQPVVRISIRSASGHERGSATGVMISPRLLLTNEHVFPDAEEARFSIAEFNFKDDIAGNPMPSFRYRLQPDLFFFNDPILDFALVSVELLSVPASEPRTRFGFHRLIPSSGKARKHESLTIIQHPSGQRRQLSIRENECIDDADPNFLTYQSDTAAGSSGAPVFNDSFQIAALHRMGKAKKEGNLYVLKDGRKVETLEDIDEYMVTWESNLGIRISKICAAIFKNAVEQNGHLEELKVAMEGGDILSIAFENSKNQGAVLNPALPQTNWGATDQGPSYRIPIHLDLQINLQDKQLSQTTATFNSGDIIPEDSPSGFELEAMREPIVDKDYSKRKGYDLNFLGVRIPMPRVKPANIVGKMKNRRRAIPYEHFSVVLHKERRLAIFTASNVDGTKASREPECGKDYTRKGLTGLRKSDQEKWLLDERVKSEYQLPDKFYTKDRQSFDKGHIVRREDVCWGPDYATVQRANGDTFHTTNCSPQRKEFNRSTLKGLWGNFENVVLKQAKTELYSLFAGPVLSEDDPVFNGVDDNGPIDVKIPRDYWKVVCAMKKGKLMVYGFMLEQDLTGIVMEEEFDVPPEFKVNVRSLKEIEKKTGYLKFPRVLHKADQGK